jgi:hypothetical protein
LKEIKKMRMALPFSSFLFLYHPHHNPIRILPSFFDNFYLYPIPIFGFIFT